MNQDSTPLFDAVNRYIEKHPTYFKIPGHRYEKGINDKWRRAVGDKIFEYDLTETVMTDDLHNASGAIMESEQLAAELWGSDYAHFLVNGTTCGNEAMILSTVCEGEKICIPRNAHKSSLYGLILSGAEPVYIMPEVEDEFGLHGGITVSQVEAMFAENPDCKGMLIVSPTYYGVTSDIEGIAKVCHRNGAVLMVDEAHGAHCYFGDDLPKGAIEAGADICVQSIHKVAGSFTQSSIIHIKSNLIDHNRVKNNLMMVQSSSPSYLLMTSLDLARHEMAMNGRENINCAYALSNEARERINKISHIACAGTELIKTAGIDNLDLTRLTISAAELGITGYELERILFNEYNIDVELSDYRNVLVIVTYANEKSDLDRLIASLEDISLKRSGGTPLPKGFDFLKEYKCVMSPREAYFAPKMTVDWKDAQGHVAGEMITPYPPGIPIIYPGELITREVWEYIDHIKETDACLQGMRDKTLNSIEVIATREDV